MLVTLAPCSGAQSRGNHQEGHKSRDEREEPAGLSYSDSHYSPTWSRHLVMYIRRVITVKRPTRSFHFHAQTGPDGKVPSDHSPALVRSPETGVGRQPIPHFNQIELRAQWISLEVSAREEQLLTSDPRAADRPLPGEIRLGLHTRPRPSSQYDPRSVMPGCNRRTTLVGVKRLAELDRDVHTHIVVHGRRS